MMPPTCVRPQAPPAQSLVAQTSESAVAAPSDNAFARFWIVSCALALLALTTVKPDIGRTTG